MSNRPEFEPRDGRLPGRAPLAGEGAEPRRGRGRRAVERTLEIVLALLLMLSCFCVLLVTLDRVFPSATGLGELLNAPRADANASQRRFATAQGAEAWREAVLSALGNEVLRKPAGGVAWDPARSGARVAHGDGVQTRREGTAVLTFDRDDWLRVGRNSLVILRNPDEGDDASATLLAVVGGERAASRAAAITLVAGEVSGSFAGRSGGAVQVSVPGGRTSMRITREPGIAAPSTFKVAVRRDHSAAITVYAGKATVTVGGRTVRLQPSQYVVLRADALVGNVSTLSAAPAASAPEDGRAWRFREFPPGVAFRWRGTGDTGLYRLEVARDPAFRHLVLDEAVEGDSLVLGSLPPGEYLWRVSELRAGVDGSPSPARRLSLVRDELPPSLEVSFPAGPIERDHCIVEGVAEPDARVFVAGEQAVAGPDGRFSAQPRLRPGTNLLIVEAVDAAGNSTYRSQVVRRAVSH